MKKIAFFVEGQTEQIFVNRLVKEIFGYGNVTIIQKKISGGTNVPKREFVRSYNTSKEPIFRALIYDCGSDNRVKSEILSNVESLRESGFTCIVGLRDLYPLPMDELLRLEKGLNFLPQAFKDFRNLFDIVVAVQEVETWFLAETDHFLKVDKRLTGDFINERLGFNPYTSNLLQREHPSEDLDRIYRLVGRSYSKKQRQVEKLVQQLNFNRVRHEISNEIPALFELIKTIEDFKKK